MDRRHSKTKCPLYAFRIVHANNQALEIVVEAKCRQQTKFLDEPSASSRVVLPQGTSTGRATNPGTWIIRIVKLWQPSSILLCSKGHGRWRCVLEDRCFPCCPLAIVEICRRTCPFLETEPRRSSSTTRALCESDFESRPGPTWLLDFALGRFRYPWIERPPVSISRSTHLSADTCEWATSVLAPESPPIISASPIHIS